MYQRILQQMLIFEFCWCGDTLPLPTESEREWTIKLTAPYVMNNEKLLIPDTFWLLGMYHDTICHHCWIFLNNIKDMCTVSSDEYSLQDMYLLLSCRLSSTTTYPMFLFVNIRLIWIVIFKGLLHCRRLIIHTWSLSKS